MESIAVYFTPLEFTKIVTVVGLKVACHMGIVYTNADGLSFGVTSGPSNSMATQTPAAALDAIVKSASNEPSSFGTLSSYARNNQPFHLGHPDDFFTQDFEGNPFVHALVVEGRDLSAPWRTIVATYEDVGKLKLTYSPVSQNSNSMAGNALRRAGLPIPFSNATCFAPGEFNALPNVAKHAAEMASGPIKPP